MKLSQIRTKDNVHMGIDLGKSILDGKSPGARFRDLSIETYEDIGVKITKGPMIAIVPWGNIVVAMAGEVPNQPIPIKHKVDTSAANS